MPRRLNGIMIVFLILIVIGILKAAAARPAAILIPVVVFGIVFLLYKYPPARFRSAYRQSRVKQPDRQRTKQQPRKRPAPFRVIEGGKDDDDMPKYH